MKYRLIKGSKWRRGDNARLANHIGWSQQRLTGVLAGRSLIDKETAKMIRKAAKSLMIPLEVIKADATPCKFKNAICATTSKHADALRLSRAKNSQRFCWEISKGPLFARGDITKLARSLGWGSTRIGHYLRADNKVMATHEKMELILEAARMAGVDVAAREVEK